MTLGSIFKAKETKFPKYKGENFDFSTDKKRTTKQNYHEEPWSSILIVRLIGLRIALTSTPVYAPRIVLRYD